jgi:hypothetical protein
MPITLNTTLKAEALGGNALSAPHSLVVEAYNALSFTVADGDSETVSLLPPAGSTVQLIEVTATHYGTDLTYELDGGSAVALDAPLLLQGTWAGELSGAFGTVAFANASGEEVTVHALIGYDIA